MVELSCCEFSGEQNITKKAETFRFPLFCTPPGCSYYALCARTARFYAYGLGIVEQKCRILSKHFHKLLLCKKIFNIF